MCNAGAPTTSSGAPATLTVTPMLGFGHDWRAGPRRVSLTYFKAGETHRSEDLTVYLDGVPVPLALEASTIEGWVMTYTAAGDDIQRDSLDRPVVARLHGRVEIRLEPGE